MNSPRENGMFLKEKKKKGDSEMLRTILLI